MRTLLLLLGLTVAATGCNGLDADPDLPADVETLVRLAPADAQMIASGDASALLETVRRLGPDSLAAHISGMLDSLSSHVAGTGIDPVRDVRQALVAIGPGERALLLVRTAYDGDRLASFILAEGGADLGAGRYRFSHDDQDLFVAMLSDDLLGAAPSEAALTEAGSRMTDGSGVAEDVAARIRPVADRTGWMAIRDIPALAESEPIDMPFGSELFGLARAIDHASFGGVFRNDAAEGIAYLFPRADVQPDDLADLIRGLIAAVRSQESMPDAMRMALERIRVDAEPGRVRIEGLVDRTLLEQMASTR